MSHGALPEGSRPRVHAPPCPDCGAYGTKFAGLGCYTKAHCPFCKKAFWVARRRDACAGDLLPWAPDGYQAKICWREQAQVEPHCYWIHEDHWYGRGWVIQINLFESGYWFQYRGAFRLLRSAKAAVEDFKDHWRDMLSNERFRAHYFLPPDVLELGQRGDAAG